MHRRAGKAVAIIVLSLSLMLTELDCSQNKPFVIVQYQSGQVLRTTEVSRPGIYALYVGGRDKPIITHRLPRGTAIGFQEVNGQVYALAGTIQHRLDPAASAHAYWRFESKDSSDLPR